ncbi:hypothetical protein MSG28_008075 [Choristoneura fumiferana]|uniref:Uncharacterized protein n=1 Tax=Choristoneura fumiferana TaxID=7141 RepID=A0ACC0J9V4_CHOFU|nr:hypothetical protein MSG28_008075 [Choristoneura fumiferana]
MASVLDLVKHYQHAIEKYPNDEQKVLKSIDKLFGLGVTVQHLQDTGVGRTVNALRKEPGEVGTAARALVNKWKAMVAAEESDQDAQNNDTTNYNGNGNGKDGSDQDHSSSKSRSRHNDSSYERTSETEVTSTSQMNGHTSGSKRKYYSSEEEDNSNKKSKHVNDDDHKRKSVNIKKEPSETDNDHEDSYDSRSSDSESEMSESSEDDRKGNKKIKEEPVENQRSSSIHSSQNHVNHKKEHSSSKKSSNSDKHLKSHNSDSRHTSDKSSSREKSQSSKKHKNSNEKESSSEKRYKSDHSITDKDKKKDSNSLNKHKSSSDKHSNSEKHHSSSEKHKSSSEKHRSTSEKRSNSLEKHSSSSEKQKFSAGKDGKSDKHKDKSDKSDKHESKSDKHSNHSSLKSDKEKRKSSTEKEAEKHKSRENSSKEKHSSSGKEKSRSSQRKEEKSNEIHKSEKKSSHENMSRSESKDKTSKSDHSSSEKKSKHKSSSSSSHKRDKSSSSKTGDVPKIKSQINNSAESDDGIDCGSGASFAEALGMVSPAKPKKKSIFTKDVSSPNSFGTDLSPATLLAPSTKLAPLPALEISALPEISPNYRPRPPPRLMPHFTDDEAMTQSISSKNQRTKVYSGNKVVGKIASLYDLCVQVLQEHIDDLEFTGGVPYEILKPIVDKATPQQLYMLEYHNPYLTEDTDHLWKAFCEKHFRNKKREEMEAWKEMYTRCQEEQEDKLKSLTANIRLTQEAKKAPIKQTKMAYVDSVVKPPRNVARKQAQHGTAFASTASPAARVAALASGPNVLRGGTVRPPTSGPVSSSSFKPKKAPLMAKALQFMRGRKR